MADVRVRDRLWLWGMRPNVLQQAAEYRKLGFAPSALTVAQAIARTGIANVLLAGGLPLTAATLAALPAARRLIAKDSLHRHGEDGRPSLAPAAGAAALAAAKELAAADPRVEAFLLDDFSTGSIAAGAQPAELAALQFRNAVAPPQLPLLGTVYEMSLEDRRLWACLPHFAGFLVPLWHAADIERFPEYVDRLAALSGGKPQLACLYLYDFGGGRALTYAQMERQLRVGEELLRAARICGLCILGTCLLDQDWEANRCLADWLEHTGEDGL